MTPGLDGLADTGVHAYGPGFVATRTDLASRGPQVQVTAAPLTGSQWIGPAVRAQNGGQSLYVGIYYWNGGNPELMLFKLVNGNWTELGSAYASGTLAAGTQLKLIAIGSTLTFAENGVVRISATDTSLGGGAPASWPTAPPAPRTGPAATPTAPTPSAVACPA